MDPKKSKEENYQKQIDEMNKNAGDQRARKEGVANRLTLDSIKFDANKQQPSTSTSKKSNSPKL